MDLIKASSSGAEAAKYIIQETVVVIQDIFRKYPERFEPIISVLCEYLDTLEGACIQLVCCMLFLAPPLRGIHAPTHLPAPGVTAEAKSAFFYPQNPIALLKCPKTGLSTDCM
jgi:hypothetical protein